MRGNVGYTNIPNSIFLDHSVSYKAKGLYCQLISLPPDWDLTIRGIASLADDGRDSVRSTLEELRKHGYVEMDGLHYTTTGRYAGYRYRVYLDPNDHKKDYRDFRSNEKIRGKS